MKYVFDVYFLNKSEFINQSDGEVRVTRYLEHFIEILNDLHNRLRSEDMRDDSLFVNEYENGLYSNFYRNKETFNTFDEYWDYESQTLAHFIKIIVDGASYQKKSLNDEIMTESKKQTERNLMNVQKSLNVHVSKLLKDIPSGELIRLVKYQEGTSLEYIYCELEMFRQQKLSGFIEGKFKGFIETHPKEGVKIPKYLEKSLQNAEIITTYKYNVTSILDYIRVSIHHILQNKVYINKCRNCGKYFIPTKRNDEVYCDNPSTQNSKKTCKEYGVKVAYRNKAKDNEIKVAHKSTYSYIYSNYYRETIASERIEDYMNEYKAKKNNYLQGKLSEKDFIEWINRQKEVAIKERKAKKVRKSSNKINSAY